MSKTKLDANKALLVFSGGQDSTTCLYWTLDKFQISKQERSEKLKTVTFNYAQKHGLELKSAKAIADFTGLDYDEVSIPAVLRSTSPLVDKQEEMDLYNSVDEFQSGVQKTFVPGRNILFLTIAANLAYHHGVKNIVLGVCEEDFGGYYDCRQDFIDAMQKSLNQGLFGEDEGLVLYAPLMNLSKKQSVELAVSLGEECMQALGLSHTCYEGVFPPCGKCHACLLRARGFEEAGIQDPLLERSLSQC